MLCVLLHQDVKDELLDLLLFTSLAASHDHDITADVKSWYKKYFHILNTLGLVLPDSTFDKYDIKDSSLNVDKVRYFCWHACGKSMTALKTLDSNNESIKLLSSRSKHSHHKSTCSYHFTWPRT